MIQEKTIPTMLAAAAEQFGDHPAIVDRGRTVSYRELHETVLDVARGYLSVGVQPGDRVAVWVPNQVEFLLALLAAQTIGSSVVPLSTRSTGHEARVLLGRCRATLLVVAEGFLGKDYLGMLRSSAPADAVLGPVIPGLESLKTVVALNTAEPADGVMSWADLIAAGQSVPHAILEARAAAVRPDDIADILFTSGTTGTPKGVMSTHQQTLSVARSWATGAQLSPEDRYLVINPFFQSWGYKAGIVSSLVSGTTIYPMQTFDPQKTLELVQSDRITVLPGVPTIFTTLLDYPQLADYDISSLRFAVAGAATVPQSLFRDMVQGLGFESVGQAYGLTECVVATMSRPNEDFSHIAETTGPAQLGVEIRIVDADNQPAPDGVDGEILLRGPNVTIGYFEDEAATRAAFDDDGWFHSGDVGRMDEHGCVKITDRLKDMFTVGGFNVYPAEVENVLRTHPAVNESAVIGIPDARLGSVGRAYVLLLRDVVPAPTPDELIEYVKERLANYKVPKDVRLVDEFPRNVMGKILKTTLRDDAEAEAEATTVN